MALLISLKEGAQEIGLAFSTLKSPAARQRLGLDVAEVRLGRRVLLNKEVLQECLRELAGADVSVRKPTATRTTG